MVALSREIERERECSFGLFPGCGRGGDGDTLPTRQCVPGFASWTKASIDCIVAFREIG